VSRYIDGHRGRFGVEPICRTLDVSASAYYYRASGERSQRVIEDERLLGVIKTTHEANYFAYGYRKMWLALVRAGETVGRDHVKRLMRAEGIQGAKRRGKPSRTTIADPAAARSPDVFSRPGRATDGLDAPRARRRRRPHPPQRCRLATRTQRVVATPGCR